MIETIQGWRYVIEFYGCQFVSKSLYPTQGAAIDAMRENYPEAEYPDADRRVMEDDEPVIK